jgi:sugar (pentulose or hexulose) kinase
MAFIGLDIGTSFIKGGVLDLDNLDLQYIQRVPFPDILPSLQQGYYEYDPQAVIEAVHELLDDLILHAGACEGLVMCGQMHGLVMCDANGQPHSTLTTWQDQRVLEPHPSGKGSYFDVMTQQLYPEDIRQMGNELRPGQPVGLLFWLAQQERLPEKHLYLASLPDFVLANLCHVPPVTEVTHAMSHGALNLETLDWHWGVLQELGLAHLRWAEIRPQGSVVGKLGINGRDLVCYTPVGDYQCALAGALLRPDELSLNISTGSQASLLRPAVEFGDFQTRPFFDGRFLIGITHIPAGRSLSLLVGLLSELAEAQGITLSDPWPYIIQAATSTKTTSMQADLAFFNSSCGDHGEITSIREEELTVGHLFRAAFQNMADNYYASAIRLSPDRNWNNIVFSGGLAQKIPVLREMICDRFKVGYRMCPTSEDTLLGLMALALAFSGRAPSVGEATELLERKYGIHN